MEQLQKIFHIVGTPGVDNWPGVELLPRYVEFQRTEPISLLGLFRKPAPDQITNEMPSSLDLLLKILALNPSKRLTAAEVSVSLTT